MRSRGWLLALLVPLIAASTAAAHPVPKNTHDRTLVVRLQPATTKGQVLLRVEYLLEVDELTAVTRDLEPYADEIDALQFRGRPEKLYGELARRLGPDLAFRLSARVNGQRTDLACRQSKATLHDDAGTLLGHLRCDFVFEATVTALPDRDNVLDFREQTYLGEEGKIDLSLANDAALQLVRSVVPDAAIKNRPLIERQPGDDDRLRELHVVFRDATHKATPQAAAMPQAAATPQAEQSDDHSLLRLLLHTDYGIWLTLLLAAVFGAAHALTPGHGKTLVAAYLVGERGTSLHAIVLGVVTTLTHTGMVVLLAVVLYCLPPETRERFMTVIQAGLGLVMGLMVACMGFWLLLQRLSGRADHFHVGGGHHHGDQESSARAQESGGLRWWRLILMGVAGGLVPCWDAIFLLFLTVGSSRFAIALPVVLAFSAGLASVLVLIGVLVVQVPNVARSRLGNGGVVRALPIVSAVLVTLMGLWLCYQGVQGHG